MRGHVTFYILGLFSAICWGQKSVEVQFDSSDNVTAGFSEISLQLYSDKKVNLVLGESVGVGQNEAGGIYKWDKNTVHGRWTVKGNLIHVSIDSTKEFVKRTFEFKKFHARGQRLTTDATLIFPVNADSVIINDIPCLRTKKEKDK